MSNPHGIIVFGANGSGKTTLARELAHILGFKHMDVEAYAFEPSEIPYSAPRSREDCAARMLADMQRYGAFVLSAVTGEFGEEIASFYDLAVRIEVPKDIRLERVEQRAIMQHGDRVRIGGDMYEGNQSFMEFVASRPLEHIDRWAETLACPVVEVDGMRENEEVAKEIAAGYAVLLRRK